MGKMEDLIRYRANLQGETDSAALYRTLAEVEAQPQLVAVYRRLAAVEEQHAQFWAQHLRSAGRPVPRPRPGWRVRVLGWLARRFGPQLVLPTIATMEQVDRHMYDPQPEARKTRLPIDER
jgi:vacuolar iron transporter family protein